MQAQQPHYFVYIFGDQQRQSMEIGIAGDLQQLTHSKVTPETSQQSKLVYYEHYQIEDEALHRERQIKGGSQDSTIFLIESMNPNWLDLSDTLEY